MHEIITAFGIDWRLIAIQIFNFTILLIGLWYFLYTPVLTLIEKRKQTIEKGLADAAEAAYSLRHAEKEKDEIVKAAHVEASAVALRAKIHADEKAAKLVHDAENICQRITEDAKKAGLTLQDTIRRECEADVARTALLAAEKILRERAHA